MTARSVPLSSVESDLFDDPPDMGAAAKEHYGTFEAKLDPGSLANPAPERAKIPPLKDAYTFGDELKTAAERAEAVAVLLEVARQGVLEGKRRAATPAELREPVRRPPVAPPKGVEELETAAEAAELEALRARPRAEYAKFERLVAEAQVALAQEEAEDVPPPCTSRWENQPPAIGDDELARMRRQPLEFKATSAMTSKMLLVTLPVGTVPEVFAAITAVASSCGGSTQVLP